MDEPIPMADIAKMAGVSISTVSRYINNKPVAAATVKRLQTCIKKLGYVPPPPERRTGPKPSATSVDAAGGAVVVLVVGHAENIFHVPAFPELFDGVQRAAVRSGKRLSFVHYSGAGPMPGERFGPDCEGLLVLDLTDAPAPEMLDYLAPRPTVFMFHRHTDARARFDQVYYDNRVVGDIAAEYLAGNGCRRFLFASHDSRHPRFIERHADFVAALAARGHDHVECVVENRLADLGARLEKRFADTDRPDGVFAAADDTLLSAWLAAKMAKAPLADPANPVPGGIVFIGCNNDRPLLQQMRPRPATVDLRLPLLGERAFEQLRWRVEHREIAEQVQIMITPHFLRPEQQSLRRPAEPAAVGV